MDSISGGLAEQSVEIHRWSDEEGREVEGREVEGREVEGREVE
jgi:hypothetical protein